MQGGRTLYKYILYIILRAFECTAMYTSSVYYYVRIMPPSYPGRWTDEHDISINLIPCLLLAACASISTRDVYIIIIITIYKCTTYAASCAHSRQTICTATPPHSRSRPAGGEIIFTAEGVVRSNVFSY